METNIFCTQRKKEYLLTEIKLKNGITINIKKFDADVKFSKKFEFNASMVSFYFCFSGIEKTMICGSKNDFIISSGKCGIFAAGEGIEGSLEISDYSPFQIVSLHISPLNLKIIAGKAFELMPRELREVINEENGCFFNKNLCMNPTAKVAVGQIINCNLEGPLKELYCEGKSLEVISCILDQFRGECIKYNFFYKDEIERIYYAKELLLKDLTNPPSLMDLAKSAGMHHSKLNKGFREKFGKTVFGYLTEARLEKARQYLEKGDMNCTEAAFSVGYSSLSHFAKAFKEQYYVSPSSYMKKIVQ
jgi:AraC-like DNA-binding protein